MTVFLALIGDVWREARDKRVVWVLALFSLAIVVSFGSLSFTPVDVDAALRGAAQRLGELQLRPMGLRGTMSSSRPVSCTIGGPRAPTPEDDFPLGIDGLRLLDLSFDDMRQLDALCVARRAFQQRIENGEAAAAPATSTTPIGPDVHRTCLEAHFLEAGFSPVIVRSVGDAGRRFVVGAGAEHPLELRGACEVSWFFHSFSTTLDGTSQAEFLAQLQAGVAERFAGFFGVLILLGMFASALPDLLQKGRFDLLLARPVGRVRLILFKYLGALLFVLLLWTILFTGCCVALGVATGFWRFGLIGCALTCTLVFGAIYPVTMLVGAATRHVTLASLAGLMAWGLEGVVRTLRTMMEHGQIGGGERWKPLVDVAYWILPKSSDLAVLNQSILARDYLSAAGATRLMGGAVEVNWWFAGGTTALFAAAMVAFTCVYVARRDW